MKNKFKLLLFLPALVLTGCGYGLKEIYKGSVYNSPDYYENFYRGWDKNINYHSSTSKIENLEEDAYQLDTDKDLVFTTFDSTNFAINEPEYEKYSYPSDIYEPPEGKLSYGQTFALSKQESSFRYGYVSKLFNGQTFCNQKYEIARVQIDESGCGMEFSKELDKHSYFALNLKASLDYRRNGENTNIPNHQSSIELLLNFFCKTSSGKYHRVPVKYQINNMPTNASETINCTNYIFFGFSLENIKIDRCIGVSIEYKLLEDKYIVSHPDEGWTHCLLLYELFFPHSTWH